MQHHTPAALMRDIYRPESCEHPLLSPAFLLCPCPILPTPHRSSLPVGGRYCALRRGTEHEGLAVGNPLAGLWYTIEDYAETIVICYGFKIEGWPTYIPFRNMSNVGGCEVLSKLIELWTEDVIKFVPATHLDKLNAALDPTLVAPGKGFVHRKNSGGRDDIGRSCYRPKTKPDGGPLRRPKDGPKSAKVVHSDDEDDSQASARPLRLIPLPLLPPFAPSQFVSSRSPGTSREVESESEIEDFSDDGQ